MATIRQDKRNLFLQLRDRIHEMIREKYMRAGDQLPSEAELVEMFSVSRSTVREALRQLEEEKVIYCRHGLGRFVAIDPSNILSEDVTRLESVTEMAERLGIQVDTQLISLKLEPAGERIGSRLMIDPRADVYILERVRRASGEVVIYSKDIFPAAVVKPSFQSDHFDGSLVDYMANTLGIRITSARATIGAKVLDDNLCKTLSVDCKSAWILLEHINFDQFERPILYSYDYYRGDKFLFHVLRRRLS
jgi:GntR family transcriptional regulator